MLGRGGIALLEGLAEASLDNFASWGLVDRLATGDLGWGLVDRLATGDFGVVEVFVEYDKLGRGGAAVVLLAGF